jgi:thiopeptide-type bacteriocin biosynthesis protein
MKELLSDHRQNTLSSTFMPYHFAKHLLLRMPVKSAADYGKSLQSFLNDSFFQAALKLATPVFFTLLIEKDFEADRLSAKEASTLLKYINRYCFRPTPFGLFSSVSLLEWAEVNNNGQMPELTASIGIAMPFQSQLVDHLLAHEFDEQTQFEINPSIYRVMNEYRFFRTGLNDSRQKREYQLQSIAFSKVLKDIVNLTQSACDKRVVINRIILSAGCELLDAADYADFLIDAQILVHTSRLSITGSDNLDRLLLRPDNKQISDWMQRISGRLNVRKQDTDPNFITELERDLEELIPQKGFAQEKLSVILKNSCSHHAPGLNIQEQLRDSLNVLELLTANPPVTTMSQFLDSYQEHFYGQSLPLLQALDPEAGIGYQQAGTLKDNPLLETVNIQNRHQSRSNNSWTNAHAVLMEAWLRDKSVNPIIRINDEELKRLKPTETTNPILGMSVLFRIVNEKVVIENAGGINAPALMGRFTVADELIEAAAKSMASHLEEQNPDIIFAELLHLTDPHTDNINRRAHIYQYELPVTAASNLPSNRQIRLSDLFIRVIDNKVMLYSEQHQKYVIPRLTSAYNYSQNKLPLFRFLADLPYQYGRSNLTLDLRQHFPKLHYYPRIEYRNTILSLATWIITEEQIGKLSDGQDRLIPNFYALREVIKLPRFIALTEGDQELIIDGQEERDIKLFHDSIRQRKEVVVKEYLEQSEVRQFNAYLLPSDPIILSKPVQVQTRFKAQRKYIPGSSWLYLKMYVPKIGIDRLLTQLVPLIKKRYNGYMIGQWFFIRYVDHAPHIRLRLLVNPNSINAILLAFKIKFENRIQQHVIREFQIDVYSRELERYAAGGIENTERFFWASSEIVVKFIKMGSAKGSDLTSGFALLSTFQIIREFMSGLDEQIAFCRESFELFQTEFGGQPIKVELDKKYRELSAGIHATFQHADLTLLTGSEKAVKNFVNSLKIIRSGMVQATSGDYLRSIIHMHLNRIFTDEARKQEMICYYLLLKYLRSVKGRANKVSNF